MSTLQRIIEVVGYDPSWATRFRAESHTLQRVLHGICACVHHIGSTSVPGLRAKPIIDILIEVHDLDSLDRHNREMKDLGYLARGEHGIPGRRFFQKGLHARTHHVHTFRFGAPEVDRHLAFRDYLRAHPTIAGAYGQLKARCARACGNDIRAYCDGKHDFVTEHTARALAWRADQLSGLRPLPVHDGLRPATRDDDIQR